MNPSDQALEALMNTCWSLSQAEGLEHLVQRFTAAAVEHAGAGRGVLLLARDDIVEARLAAERIVRDGHRAGDVLASIRELARKAPPRLVELDLNDVVDEVLALARNKLERHEISVSTQSSARRCAALADRVQMQQVILNLVVNGIEAMSEADAASRVLNVRTETIDDRLVAVAVSDTGRGLGTGDPERVFGAFYTSKVGGIGMGLSICRSIVEHHGGRMGVSANAPQGCTFSFELPAHVPEHRHVRAD